MNIKTIALGALLVAGLAASAMADSYSGDSWYLQLSSSGSIMAPGAFGGTINGSSWSGGGAGALKFTQVSGDTYTAPGGSPVFNEASGFLTYCTDIGVHINWGQKYEFLPMVFEQANTVFPPPGVQPQWDWSASYKGIYYAAVIYNKMLSGTAWAQSLTTETETAGQLHGAAQIAIWETLYDSGGWNLTGGEFTVTSGDTATRTVAAAMLTWLSANKGDATYDQTWLQPLNRLTGTAGSETGTYTEGAFQGMLYKEGGLRTPDVGSAAGMLGFLFAGFVALSRKMRK